MNAPAAGLRILGVDPGTRVVGWGVVEALGGRLRAVAHGTLEASPEAPIGERLRVLARGLEEVVRRHAPAEAALEEAFHGRDARSALRIGEGRGAVLVVLAESSVPVTGYANNVVKKAVAGGGRASKERVQSMVARVLGLATLPAPFDAADALALAICHWQRRGRVERGLAPPGLPPRIAAAIAAVRASEGLKTGLPRRS
jgi:crossover junction endodeoxyribonuclease RuvC